MVAGAKLVAALARDDALTDGLATFAAAAFGRARVRLVALGRQGGERGGTFVVGRGYGLGCVREIALKVAEVLRVPALGYSAAELRHGPRAAITSATPVLVLRQNDEAAAAIDDLVQICEDAGESAFTAGGRRGRCPGSATAIRLAIRRHAVPAYRAIEAAARRRGLDPDNPPYLSKVTRTTMFGRPSPVVAAEIRSYYSSGPTCTKSTSFKDLRLSRPAC